MHNKRNHEWVEIKRKKNWLNKSWLASWVIVVCATNERMMNYCESRKNCLKIVFSIKDRLKLLGGNTGGLQLKHKSIKVHSLWFSSCLFFSPLNSTKLTPIKLTASRAITLPHSTIKSLRFSRLKEMKTMRLLLERNKINWQNICTASINFQLEIFQRLSQVYSTL